MSEMTTSELARRLGGQLAGDGGRIIRGVSSLESAAGDQVAFLANARYEKFMGATSAGAVIVTADYTHKDGDAAGPALIRCSDPYFAFRQAMVEFYGFRRHPFDGVDPRACVDPTATIEPGAKVSPFVTVGPACRIGAGSVLYAGVYVGKGAVVGRDCILYPNVTLYDGTILHDRVTIHAGSSIGHDGFGYATHKGDGGVLRHEKIPQAGYVEIEDDVEIGACCAIDRATIGATVIGAGTKFSNLVAIGHGTHLGKHCLLVAQSGLAGSVHAGNYCVFAGQAGVVGHIKIGDGVKVGAQSGVTNDVPAGQEVLGSPAMPLAQMRRVMASFAAVPEMRSAIRKIIKEITQVKKHLGLKGDHGKAES